MPLFLISRDLPAEEQARLSDLGTAILGSAVEVAIGIPDALRDYQRRPYDPEIRADYRPGVDFCPVRSQEWGPLRDGWIPLEIPPEGLLLAGDPSPSPDEIRAARAAALAAELAADPDLAAAIELAKASQ